MSHPFGKSPETQVIWSIIRTKLQILPSYHLCISKVFPLPKKKKKKHRMMNGNDLCSLTIFRIKKKKKTFSIMRSFRTILSSGRKSNQ